jgi:transposase-like protein
MPLRYQRPCPPEFRRPAIGLVKASGRSIKAIAGELGVSEDVPVAVEFAAAVPM